MAANGDQCRHKLTNGKNVRKYATIDDKQPKVTTNGEKR